MTVSRAFAPINGLEAKQIILREIERALDADWRFKQHVTFPLVRWNWKLHFEIGGFAKSEFKLGTAVGAENGGEVADKGDLEFERIIEAPAAGQKADEVRRENGIGVPEPRLVPVAAGVMQTVDEPELKHTPEPIPVTVGGADEPVVATPRNPVIAKSTSLKLKTKK